MYRAWHHRADWAPYAAICALLAAYAALGASDWTTVLIVAGPIAVLGVAAMRYAARH